MNHNINVVEVLDRISMVDWFAIYDKNSLKYYYRSEL